MQRLREGLLQAPLQVGMMRTEHPQAEGQCHKALFELA